MTSRTPAGTQGGGPGFEDPELAGRRVVSLSELGLDEASPKPVWYKRRAWLLAIGIVAVLGTVVALDYPHRTTHAQQLADAKSFLAQIKGDVTACNFGLNEATTVYRDAAYGHLTAQQRGEVPHLLQDDLTACSYTNSQVYSLDTISVPRNLARTQLTNVAASASTWAFPDAATYIENLAALDKNPANAKARSQLRPEEVALARERSKINSEVAAVQSQLHTKLPPMNLTRVPVGFATTPPKG
ncbi:MAG: hypothetical protein M0Z87_02170 [Actinomycetota bacterium]|nr:hypothetical protein [Actinomycetota bacterium]